jgi:poly(hydroxyalkanoate) depolymerase family esterase
MRKQNGFQLLACVSVLLILLCWQGASLGDWYSPRQAIEFDTYVPEELRPGAAMVVFLHGCGQKSSTILENAGWQKVANTFKFVLLLPVQQSNNNYYRCFNWFESENNQRDKGELKEIVDEVQRQIRIHDLDRKRIFVAGFSAGGAMAAAALAAYPEQFAAGAILAGVPYGCANSLTAGLDCMKMRGRTRTPEEWGNAVRVASSYSGKWPRVSIWHGRLDDVVVSKTGLESLKQWTNIHGVSWEDVDSIQKEGFSLRSYKDKNGVTVVEYWEFEEMRHAIPIDPGPSIESCGTATEYITPMKVCAAYRLVTFFGLH